MNDVLSLIDPPLLDALNELAQQDLIIQNCLLKSNTKKELINSLAAAIICITDREYTNISKLETILKNNPQIQKFLEVQNDQSLLCDEQPKI